jgi:hypothetical protein
VKEPITLLKLRVVEYFFDEKLLCSLAMSLGCALKVELLC